MHFAPLEPNTRKHALYREVTGDGHSCGTSDHEMLRHSLTGIVTDRESYYRQSMPGDVSKCEKPLWYNHHKLRRETQRTRD